MSQSFKCQFQREVIPMNRTSWIVVAAACVVAVSLRLIDGPYMNFSALGALAVLCGAVVRPAWLGILIPLGCRVLTDSVIEAKTGHGFYGSWMFDYAAYVAIFSLGTMDSAETPSVCICNRTACRCWLSL